MHSLLSDCLFKAADGRERQLPRHLVYSAASMRGKQGSSQRAARPGRRSAPQLCGMYRHGAAVCARKSNLPVQALYHSCSYCEATLSPGHRWLHCSTLRAHKATVQGLAVPTHGATTRCEQLQHRQRAASCHVRRRPAGAAAGSCRCDSGPSGTDGSQSVIFSAK